MSVNKILVTTVMIFMFNLIGCATSPKETSEIGVKEFEETPVVIEEGVYPKESKLSSLKEQIKEHFPVKKSQSLEKVAKVKEKSKPKHIVSAREIQTALKNAGYYAGAIDGKIGHMTDKAIRAFQKDNNLKVDGIVGQRTWAFLNKHLSSIVPLPRTLISPAASEKATQSNIDVTQESIVSEPTSPPEPLPAVAVDMTPLEEKPLVAEEDVPARRNFAPFIVVIIIALAVVLIISIYRRKHS